MPDTNWIGNPSQSHPLPMRLRNCNIAKKMGGSYGYRGKGFGKMRSRVLYLARERSSATGLSQQGATLEVDHIMPYRQGGVGPHTNELTNFRVLDAQNNDALDYAKGFNEKPRRRRMRQF